MTCSQELLTMTDINERLASLETQQQATNKAIERLTDAMTTLTREVGDVIAALKHPDASHCTRQRDIDALDETSRDHETRLRALETTANTAKGGGWVVKWLLGGGMMAIIALLTWIAYAVQHVPAK
jgi:chromosome segregation ATPase